MAGCSNDLYRLSFKNKDSAAFDPYSWSGESVKMIPDSLEKASFEVVAEGLKNIVET